MHLCNGQCCGKADTAAAAGLGTRAVAAIEAVEQVFRRTIWQAFHGVFKQQSNPAAFLLHRDTDFAAFIGILHGIVQQHVNHL